MHHRVVVFQTYCSGFVYSLICEPLEWLVSRQVMLGACVHKGKMHMFSRAAQGLMPSVVWSR